MKRIELPKESHPDSAFNVRPYTPKVRKNPDHLAIEWPFSRWIKVYEQLTEASHKTNPADIELRAAAKEIRDEILAATPQIY